MAEGLQLVQALSEVVGLLLELRVEVEAFFVLVVLFLVVVLEFLELLLVLL